ncbi:MAG TPA: sigma-70 family RNA polymerase sigma factor [Cyclobacteriaceae bacterium]|nr:sigma-70 family RNA polymerase sigma factor [Cyclobacteriaceae bacterium]
MLDLTATLTEEEIIRKATEDPGAFKPLYETNFKKIFLFVFHRVGDKEASADITQQVFLNALSNIGKYQFRGLPFSSWLFRIAVNQCNDFFRKNKKTRMVVLEDPHIRDLYQDLTADQSWDEWERKLPAVLEQLSEDDLQLIELRYFEQRPFKEVSEIMGLTESNTKVRTYRILGRMKKIFLQK